MTCLARGAKCGTWVFCWPAKARPRLSRVPRAAAPRPRPEERRKARRQSHSGEAAIGGVGRIPGVPLPSAFRDGFVEVQKRRGHRIPGGELVAARLELAA